MTEDDFQTGLANGEFFEVQDITGATKYSWDLLEHTTAKGITHWPHHAGLGRLAEASVTEKVADGKGAAEDSYGCL